jgi:hypothetical protein
MHTLLLSLFAATYGSNAYDTSTYGGNVTTQTSTGGAAGGGLQLSNTGIAIASIVTIACLILLVAILVRVWRRPAKNVDPSPEA